jgi:putative Holliday junction resolvase
MKILALDIGDRWTGIAISDPLQMLARPYKTVASEQLNSTIADLIATEPISIIVAGYPKTLRGTESQQTHKIKATFEKLEEKFSSVKWVLWDERLTSKQAARIQRPKTKEDKLQSHSIAAALILGSYLDHLNFLKNMLE